ncbi:MAG: FkbM family methyltransferase [Bacteroidetes bacterium]|nr:FkbM family methyltransferase [Bacteroidota bacterium]
MYNILKKVGLNFGFSAFNALGFRNYFLTLVSLVLSIPQIFAKKDLSPFDKKVGNVTNTLKVNFFGKKVVFPVKEIEQIIQEESYTYGVIREMVFRKCYFQNISKEELSSVKTVVDLGANRGAFSTLMTSFADQIIAVECQEKYQTTFRLLMKENNYTNYKLVNKYICGREQGEQFMTFDQLLDSNNIKTLDFLKIDIEGSEYGLFENSKRLKDVKHIAMEVHPDKGNPQELVDVFVKNGFEVKAVNRVFEATTVPKEMDFIYAKRKKS